MNKEFLRMIRGVSYLLSYIFMEYPRGLDFSLRNKSSGITLLGNHGYALTSKKALQNILKEIPFAGKTFLDIGSGKGGVICYAYLLGCSRCAGVEFEKHLHEIAEKNINILKLRSYCTSYNMDARDFDMYENFDIYFLFNPFDYGIYEQVISKIVTSNLNTNNEIKYLICYGDANIKTVIESNYFELVKESECPYRGNLFRIFRSKTPVN